MLFEDAKSFFKNYPHDVTRKAFTRNYPKFITFCRERYKAPDAAFRSHCIRGFDLLPVLSGRKHQIKSELFLFRRRIRQRQKLRRVTVAKTGNRLPVLGLFSEDPVVPGSAVSVGIAITHLQIYSLSIRSLSKKIHFCSFGERVFHTYRPFKTAESRRKNCCRFRIYVNQT